MVSLSPHVERTVEVFLEEKKVAGIEERIFF